MIVPTQLVDTTLPWTYCTLVTFISSACFLACFKELADKSTPDNDDSDDDHDDSDDDDSDDDDDDDNDDSDDDDMTWGWWWWWWR